MERDERIKWDVFQAKSTYQNDYRRIDKAEPPRNNKFVQNDKEPAQKPVQEFVPIDLETFVPWKKNTRVPFDLYHLPKEIVRTNPSDIKKMPEPIVDHEKEEIIKTRPRVYMKSAISLDDIPDRELRQFLCSSLYTTETRSAQKEVHGSFKLKPMQIISLGEKQNFDIEREVFPNIPPGWHGKINDWDRQQIRSVTKRNEMFWRTTKLPTRDGGPLKDIVPDETKKEIRQLIDEDRLRMPHDYLKSGYDGYKCRLSYGIPLRKSDEAVTHPFISTSQAITKRYETK